MVNLDRPTLVNLNRRRVVNFTGVCNLIRGNDGTTSSSPKAYINYIILDDQLKYVTSGFSRVGTSGSVKNHWNDASMQNVPVPKNGYLYVYVSNESNQDVFFDNLQVVHVRGPILEETHYYPFGLTMAGILSKAVGFGSPLNNMKYNGKELQSNEFSDGSGLEEYDFHARLLDPQLGVWHNIDPLASKFFHWSPYASMGDNPICNIDPNGKKYVNFDENGNYIGITKNNWWHNLWHGNTGRVLNSSGDAVQKFKFADPKHDVQDIKNGIINKLVFVKEEEITKMMATAGVFDPKNKIENSGDRYSYFLKEGKGGGKLDFSYSAIPNMYGASKDPLNKPSNMIFLVDGVAHNHMNFGNFLFGAAGAAIGLSLPELLAGAQFNSVRNSKTNGYSAQFDSMDDQYSIMKGFDHGYENDYKERIRTGRVIVDSPIPVFPLTNIF